jgi:hypothetical protein
MSDVVVPKPISIVSTKTETRRGTVDSAGHAASSRQRLLRAFNYFFLTLALIFVLLSIPIIL